MLNSLKRSKNFAGGDSLDALAQSEAEWLRANNDDIVRTLCNKELLERVLGIIEELPDKRREVFRLSFLHDMSNAENRRTARDAAPYGRRASLPGIEIPAGPDFRRRIVRFDVGVDSRDLSFFNGFSNKSRIGCVNSGSGLFIQ